MATTASEAYAAARKRLDAQLRQITTLLHAHAAKAEPRNWGYAGDLAHVVGILDNAIEFLGGVDLNRVVDELEKGWPKP